MISEQYVETLLTVKEMLSSAGGYYTESMCPLIGGPKHGSLIPFKHLQGVYHVQWDEPKSISGKITHVYKLFPIVIDDTDEGYNTMYVFKHEPPFGPQHTDGTIYKLTEAWAHEYYETRMNEL